MGDRVFRILLVEDNPADVRLLREALAEHGYPIRLQVFEDGQSAIDSIMADVKNEEWQRCRPDLILLDLNLPKVSGLDVLQIIKSHKLTRLVPVIVLSSSSAVRDVQDAYRLLANCYVQKPTDLNGFYTLIKSMQLFWMTTATLPLRS